VRTHDVRAHGRPYAESYPCPVETLDVDLDLTSDTRPECMIRECSNEAVMLGVISTPCGCPQPLCLRDYDRERPLWEVGDDIWCYLCKPQTVDNCGTFIRWERL
jgi:hypothetical protein